MSALYLDGSAIFPMLVREPGTIAIDAFLRAHKEELLISEFASAEVASVVSRLVRTSVLTTEQGRETLNDFDLWRGGNTQAVDVQSADVRSAATIVRRFELMLRAPDALHLAVAQRLSARLVTMDRRLATAANDLGVAAALVSV